MVANGKLPDSYESLVAAFDLEDELIPDTELEAEIDVRNLFTALPLDEL
jgi:hypothetical protein